MEQNFYKWHEIKSELNRKVSEIILHDREIWWCSIGMNVGEETFGKGTKFTRPVLILKKLTQNSFMALPLTTKNKNGSWYVQVNFQGRIQVIMLNQARIMDKKRLRNIIGTLDDMDFFLVQQRFTDFYAPLNSHSALLGRRSMGQSLIVTLVYSLARKFVNKISGLYLFLCFLL